MVFLYRVINAGRFYRIPRNIQLRNEFDNLYRSLFDNPDRYEKVIIALSSSWKGMGRGEILAKTKMNDGGGITLMLQ
jgi:hypothetical protein